MRFHPASVVCRISSMSTPGIMSFLATSRCAFLNQLLSGSSRRHATTFLVGWEAWITANSSQTTTWAATSKFSALKWTALTLLAACLTAIRASWSAQVSRNFLSAGTTFSFQAANQRLGISEQPKYFFVDYNSTSFAILRRTLIKYL